MLIRSGQRSDVMLGSGSPIELQPSRPVLHESNGMVSKLDHEAVKMNRPFVRLNPVEDTNLFLRALRLRRGMCNGGSHMKSFRSNNMLDVTEGTA